MNKEKLNDIMNCECLQTIIANDSKKHTIEENRGGIKTIQTSNECGEIIFECFTSYKNKVFDSKNNLVIDRNEKDTCGIPFLYCPICGTKTKHDIPKESFYEKFQK